MKKLTLLLATAAVSLSAFAVDSYKLHGQILSGSAWEDILLTEKDGKWERTDNFVKGEFGIIPLVDGNRIDNAWIAAPKGGETTISEVNKEYATASSNTTNFKSTLEGKYTVIYDPEAKTIQFVPYQGEIEEVITYALRGTIVDGEWNDFALTEGADGNLSTKLTVKAGTFGLKKMVNGSEKEWYAADGSPVMAEAGEYQAKLNGTNWTSTLAGEYTFSFNPTTLVLTVTGNGDDPNPQPEYPENLVLVSEFTGWGNSGKTMTSEGNGVYTTTVDATANGNFRFISGTAAAQEKWWESIEQWGAGAGDNDKKDAVVGENNLMAGGKGNFIITEAANYTFKVDLANLKMTLTKNGGVDPQPVVVPETLYMIGNVPASEGEWSSSKGVAMTKVGDTFTCITPISDAGEGYGYFSFCQVLGDDWDTVNSMDRFGAATKDQEVVLGSTAYDFTTYKAGVNASSCQSFKIAASEPKMNYLFTMDFKTGKLTIDQKTGIDSIEAENGVAVYYNLQGQRVENPANGLFVRVLNGKATKVMVK